MMPLDDRVIVGLCAGLALVYLVLSGVSFGSMGLVTVLLALLVITLNVGKWP